MPTYQYRCRDCGEELEVVQKFTDDPLSTCPTCEGRLRKVFGAVGVVFKGSGFYRTDSRPDGAAAKAEPATGDGAKADKPKETAGASSRSSGASTGGSSSPSASSAGGAKAAGAASSGSSSSGSSAA